MAEQKERDMTSGVIWKELLYFFFPLLLSTLFQQLYNAVDAIIVGKFVGTEALAAVGGSPAVIINLIVSIFVSLTTGSSVIIAQLYGAGHEKDLKKAVGTAMTFFILMGFVLIAVFEPFVYQALRLLGTPRDTVKDAADYLYIWYTSFPVLMLLNAEMGILRAVGDSKTPLLFMVISCLANIFLDLLFVITFRMGVKGVAWATVIAMFINMMLCTVKILRTKEAYKIRIKDLGTDIPMLKKMMEIGIPSAVSGSMYGISNAILQASVNSLGTVNVASWALSGKIDGVYWAASNAFGAAVTTFIGQNYGAKKTGRVKESVKVSLKLFIPLTMVLCIVIMLAAPLLLPIFSDDISVQETTYRVLSYFVPFYLLWTFIEILEAVMRGCGEVKIPVIITAIGICVFRIVWVATVCRVHNSLLNVSLCYPLSWAVTDVAMLIYFLRWRKKL